MKKLVVFDMDGTILNTLEDIKNSLNYALEKVKLPTRTLQEVRSFVGDGIKTLIARGMNPVCDKVLAQKVYEYFSEFYKEHCNDFTAPYEGIIDLIKNLKKLGYKTAVVSNKDDYGVKILCKQFFSELFDCEMGVTPSLEKKPAPDMVLKVLEILGESRETSVYVGDSDVDYATAKNSDLDFIGVEWGFKGKEFLLSLGTKYIAEIPSQVEKILREEL